MSEAQRIVALSHRAHARGDKLCLATVVHVEGSAYRKPGARMLVTSGGERAGTISGGCLETEVSRKAWWLTANGPHIEHYSSFADEDGSTPYGLGCGGTVSLLLEQGEPAQAVLAALDRVVTTRQPFVIVTSLGNLSPDDPKPKSPQPHTAQPSHAGTLAVLTLPSPHAAKPMPIVPVPGLFDTPAPNHWEVLYLRPESHPSPASTPIHTSHTSVESSSAAQGSSTRPATLPPALADAAHTALTQRRSCLLTSHFLPCPAPRQEPNHAADAPVYLVEYLAPPPAVTIFGAGDDAQPLAELAHTLGWRVTIADGRANLARRDRFPQAAEVRVLDYADPTLRAACGIPHPAPPSSRSASTYPPSPAHATHRHPSNAVAALLSNAQLPGSQSPDELAIILTHSYEQDRALLTALLPRPPRYLGILGPRHRTLRLLSEVAPTLNLSIEEAFARLHSPIGLDLGAGDPATVALSIIAEIQAVLQGREVHIDRSAQPLPLLLAGD